ncbi:MAG: T9SS type A sorting domain-containing protein [Bacteroidota bacterium]
MGYFLVYHFVKDEIVVTYPNGDEEPMVPGVEEPLRWDAYGNTGNFTIEYSLDDGGNWNMISNSVAGNLRYFNWTPPASPTGKARIRVSRNGQSDESDTGFTIIEEPNFEINGIANNEAVISWDTVPGAASYDIFRLGDKYMEVIGSTTTTSYTLQNLVLNEEKWYSVRAVDSTNNIVGRRAYAQAYRYYVCQTDIFVNVVTDDYPGETTWSIFDDAGNKIAGGGGYSEQETLYSTEVCVPYGCLDFVIYDAYGDGICCSWGQGNYQVVGPAGEILASGGAFGFNETANFCLEAIPFVMSLTNQTDLLCHGDSSGIITVEASGGTSDYTYSINGGTPQMSNTFTNLPAGVHTVVVDDGDATISMEVTLTEPLALELAVANQNNLICYGASDGLIEVTGQGGSGNLQYQINNQGFQNDPLFENLASGSYTVEVMDENGCTTSETIEISAPEAIIIELTNQNSATCAEPTGSVTVNISGGTGMPTITFNGSTINSNFATFENLSAGVYPVLVVDENACAINSSLEIIGDSPTQLEVTDTQDVTACNGDNTGIITVQSLGGSGNYTYTLNGVAQGNNNSFTNLVGGTYSIVSTDDQGCATSTEVIIQEPTAVVAEITQLTNISCHGANDGSLQVSASGGTDNFEYSNGLETNTSGIFNNLTPGTYQITITDGNNCQTIMEPTIEEPTALTADIATQQAITCHGGSDGSVSLTAAGGTGTINYTLNGNTNTSGTFSNLTVGNYNVAVSDMNGCTTNISFTIDEPTELTADIVAQQTITCYGGNDGFVILTSAGGTGTINYTLNGNSNTTGEFSNLMVGNYTVEISDANGCVTSIPIEIDEPTQLSIELESTNQVACAGQDGVINVSANGGTGDYEFSLNNLSNSTGSFTDLVGDIYLVQVTDGNGCTAMIEVDINEPNPLSVSVLEIQDITCHGLTNGSIQLVSQNATGTSTYTLGTAVNTTGFFENLSSGNYTIWVEDEIGCTFPVDVAVVEPNLLEANVLSVTEVSCYEGADGEINLTTTGGTGIIQFTLSGISNTTGTFENLESGSYEVLMEDENGCTQVETVTLAEPDELVVSVGQTTMDTGMGNGTVTLSGVGGTGTLLYSINGVDFQVDSLFTNLTAGNYEGFTLDENGCFSTISFTILLETSIYRPLQGIEKIAASPNPFSEQLFLEVELEKSQDLALTLWTVSGVQVFQKTIHFQTGKSRIDLAIDEQLTAGIYFLKVNNRNGSIGYFKLVKQ